MEWFLLALILSFIGYHIYVGYQRETTPPVPLKDNGTGIMEPVCAACQAKLITITRDQGGGLSTTFARLFGVIGVVTLLFTPIVGVIVLILAVLIAIAGKSRQTVLTCPACGKDARIIH